MSATILALNQVTRQHSGDKIRIVARTLAYDSANHILLVAHDAHALLVDVSLCLNPKRQALFLRPKSIVMLIGRLELSEVALPVPAHSATVTVDDQLVLRAVLARHLEDTEIDLATWSDAISRDSSVASFAPAPATET
ncbi:hypothetical protein EXIGLDRAFT_835427 [Exidia glandulosa HHB12029]|uniref:Uncharacterized protein n=1 Tax=Exidia glandulosa HHB12029 TaxID=1314781 RepID=A0A165IT07_EXIGL|nr:hypothetical protein EXIGLDRAFT_835427 [Exidia glandulosa HHB12029]